MTAFSVTSCDSQVSIFAVADVMEKNGWTNGSARWIVSISHPPLTHSRESSAAAFCSQRGCHHCQGKPRPLSYWVSGLYGMVAKIPDKAVVNDFILEFFNELYTL
ncbi:hypothetical protein GBAR_LOCUS29135 [Geodia barretti]|uniref:Uncharacterized protein n=1 Tax=Geodia barretti TaxID=519541 RepID=A0AA35XC53_GEOBA|nr:hypothetical protein GBAR_LOCUS29135 [Geodia barretti]